MIAWRPLALVLLLALAAANAGKAQISLPWPGPGTPNGGAATYTGPGDITSFTAWYGERAYTAAIAAAATQKLFNVRRASDNETCDFIVTTAGGIGNSANCSGSDNGISLATFLNATSGFFTKIYDQTGGGRDISQATAADQPGVVLNCVNSTLPCGQLSTNVMQLASAANFTPSTGAMGISVEMNRTTGTGISGARVDGAANNQVSGASGTANKWRFGTGATNFSVTANDAAWHAGNGIIATGTNNSILNVDGTETTGTVTLNTTAGTISWTTAASTTLDFTEFGFADTAAWSSGTRGSLHTNMAAYWGSP